MRHGYTFAETAVTLAVVGVITAIARPRVVGWLDWVAVERSADELTSALAVTRARALATGARTRLSIDRDTLRLDEWHTQTWIAQARWRGPAEHGVALSVSNSNVSFSPAGVGWGTANTTVVLTRGLHIATITTSRLGRVKRW